MSRSLFSGSAQSVRAWSTGGGRQANAFCPIQSPLLRIGRRTCQRPQHGRKIDLVHSAHCGVANVLSG